MLVRYLFELTSYDPLKEALNLCSLVFVAKTFHSKEHVLIFFYSEVYIKIN